MKSTLNIVEATGLEFHPLANIFPLMDEEELKRLTEDIRKNGQREPIKLYEGKILDGRNRYRACVRLGIDPVTEEYTGNDALDYVVSRNMFRRHLNESQRAWAALKITTLRRGDGQASIEAYSQKEAALLFKISRSAIQRAAQVANKGIPALKEAVSEGTISVAAALGVAALPPEKQDEVMALPTKRAVLKAVRQLHQHPQDCECALCADKKLRTLPVTTMFTGAELKQFDRARKSWGETDSREDFIHYLVTNFSDEENLPPTKAEIKKIIKQQEMDAPDYAENKKESDYQRKTDLTSENRLLRESKRAMRHTKSKSYKPYQGGIKI